MQIRVMPAALDGEAVRGVVQYAHNSRHLLRAVGMEDACRLEGAAKRRPIRILLCRVWQLETVMAFDVGGEGLYLGASACLGSGGVNRA